ISKDRSEMNIGDNSGYFVTTDDIGNSTSSAHEFGHGLGLYHYKQHNLVGTGQPGIMAARGWQVDPEYCYKGGTTINPYKRKVLQSDIQNVFKNITFNEFGVAAIGSVGNKIYYNMDDRPTVVKATQSGIDPC